MTETPDAQDTNESDSWGAPTGTPVPPAPSRVGDPPNTSSGLDGLVNSVKSAIAEVDSQLSKTTLPFDSVRSGLEWWYRPFIETRTWVAFGSLFVGAIWGPVMLALAASVFFVTFGLVFVVVGLLLIVPAFAAFDALAGVERRRAGWIGAPIAPPVLDNSAQGFFPRIAERLSDPARWRQLLFFAAFAVIGPVLLALGSAPWGVLISSISGSDLEPLSFGFTGFLFALIAAGAAPRITVGVAWLGRAFTESLLGPSEHAELQERVTELSDQREQILEAVGEERRRIERNLHDGVQQQLVALGIDIARAKARVDTDPDGAKELLADARDKVRGSIGELRMIGRGLNPAVLEDRGLDAALSAVVAGAPIPITVDVTTTTALPDDVASTAYYVASEAVANMLKHSKARVGSIRLADDVTERGGRAVTLTVHDDGRGGADPASGTGLAGIRARVEGADGTFLLGSPEGGPTTLVVVLPVDRTRS